ncbi:L-aspartate oxidase [Salipaludibacillus sp. CF4.18]|uniref:L-aspartate oxidase n=1 Tax=Salipaludibacillus sp. CF4.18 TaxID=3373081 RepID=UPI003EE4A40E
MKTDVLIIGGGLAAMMAASKLVADKQVTMVLKGRKTEGNSWRAQGGIAVALSEEDSPTLHMEDTLHAGCFQNNRALVDILVNEGPKRLKCWIYNGLLFDKTLGGSFSLGKEGAHSQRRIVHAGGDRTGDRTMTYFSGQLRDKLHMKENCIVIDLIIEKDACIGALIQDEQGDTQELYADQTILATGGLGGLFQESSNDETITGDGIALAYRAGARLLDLEYIQFHPTLIVSNHKVIGLASEALRGEGAKLVNSEGELIMKDKHPLGDLAPRDVVARVLYSHIEKGNDVYLDITDVQKVDEHFPQIKDMCVRNDVDWEGKRIPVRPGAHFHMGGVQTDEYGRTSVQNLFAVGEVAGSGVHGANRLASNSLLEAIVFGERVGEWISGLPQTYDRLPSKSVQTSENSLKCLLPPKSDIRKQVTNALGVVRTEKKLLEFLSWLESYQIEKYQSITRNGWSKKELERSNMMLTAFLIAKAALNRKKSIGAHFMQSEEERVEHESAFIKATVI